MTVHRVEKIFFCGAVLVAQAVVPVWASTLSLYCEGLNTVSEQSAPYKQGKRSAKTFPPFKTTRVLEIDATKELIYEGVSGDKELLSDGVSVTELEFSVFTIRPIPWLKDRGKEGTRFVSISINRVTGSIDYLTSYWHPSGSDPRGEWSGRQDEFTGSCKRLDNVKPKF